MNTPPSVILVLLSAASAVMGCSSSKTGAVPRFETVTCRFDLPAGQIEGKTVSCGDLFVLEDRARPGGSVLRLHVLRFHSASAPNGPPTLFLEGGPGEYVGSMIKSQTPDQVTTLTAAGDFLVLDFRGVEKSVPAFDCPAFSGAGSSSAQTQALLTCYANYATSGFDVANYRSKAVADDIEDLRATMGYAQLNLYGVSYGTRFALEVMRRHPDGVRAVVLDSPVPPQTLWWASLGKNLQAAYRGLFAACATDPSCNAKYPNLESQLLEAVDSLNQDPLPITVGSTTFSLDGKSFVALLNLAMYDPSTYPEIPWAVDGARRRDASVLGQAATQAAAVSLQASEGMSQAVACNDSIQYSSEGDVTQAQQGVSAQIEDAFAGKTAVWQNGCAGMPHRQPDPVDIEPVTSSIPSLIIVGELDPVTPPANGDALTTTLSRATLLIFPMSGHTSSMRIPCGQQLRAAFIASPDTPLDTACLSTLGTLTFQ